MDICFKPWLNDEVVWDTETDDAKIICFGEKHRFSGGLSIRQYVDDVEIEDMEEIGEILFNAYSLDYPIFDISQKDFDGADPSKRLFFSMDEVSADAEFYYAVFRQHYPKLYRQAKSGVDDLGFVSFPYLVTLDRLHVNPEHRGNSVGKFVQENIFYLMYHYFHIAPMYVIGSCNPDAGEPKNMLLVQQELLKKSGYNVSNFEGHVTFSKFIFDEGVLG